MAEQEMVIFTRTFDLLTMDQLTASALGWANHARYGNTAGLRKAILGGVNVRQFQNHHTGETP